uniref:PDZ domain-containing protein n=1 Tax=Meloidogyne hapla TaxID=6305 RepID=A0A1I8BBE6_MELHA
MNLRRMSDCIVISPSDMIVIDYPDVQRITVHLHNNSDNILNQTGNQPSVSATAFPAYDGPSSSSLSSSPLAAGISTPSLLVRRQSGDCGWKGNNQSQSSKGVQVMTMAPPPQRSAAPLLPQQQKQYSKYPHHRIPPTISTSSNQQQQLCHQHNNNNHLFNQQQKSIQHIPVTNSPITLCHRVPSPAPTFSSPVKDVFHFSHHQNSNNNNSLHHQQQNRGGGVFFHPQIILQQHHAKSNSMSSGNTSLKNQQKQKEFLNKNTLNSNEVELPYIRVKQQQPKTLPRTKLDEINGEFLEEKICQDNQFSPPRQKRISISSLRDSPINLPNFSNSLIQQKKAIFEPSNNSSTLTLNKKENKEENWSSSLTTLKIKEEIPKENFENSNNDTMTKTKKNTKLEENLDEKNLNLEKTLKEKIEENVKEVNLTEKPKVPKSPITSTNFQRLSKIRLNMGSGRRNTQVANDEDISALETLAANVRIRQQSPQQNRTTQTTGASSINKIRQSIASSVSAITVDDSEDCFAGLPETSVDNEMIDDCEDDDEDEEEGSCPSHDSFHELRDSVRECLEKEPSNRTGEDLAILIEFMSSLPSLAQLPMSIKRQLCLKMVFAVVPTKGTSIMQHGERIDAWSVVVNGSVEHVHSNGQHLEYRLGDCFGVQPIAQTQYNDGEIRTLADDCEFILVEHGDFYSIMSSLSRQIERENDEKSGEVVREVERRMVDNQVELVVTKASPERLLRQLLLDEEDDLLLAATSPTTDNIDSLANISTNSAQMDSHFVEDFLLMHRVFFSDSSLAVRQLIDWFRLEPKHRERVARIMLIWLNNHFEDFEGNDSNGKMTALLNEFDQLLADARMFNHQCLMSITCSVKSQSRQVTLTRSDRSEPLSFKLVGGSTYGGIFVMSVEAGSSAEKVGLRRGDELLEVNGKNMRKFSLSNAEDIIRESTHLSITLKTNWIGFQEALLHYQEDQQTNPTTTQSAICPPKNTNTSLQTTAVPSRYQKKCSVPSIAGTGHHKQHPQRERRSTLSAAINQAELNPNQHHHHHNSKAGSATPTSGGNSISHKKVLNKLIQIIRGSVDDNNVCHQHKCLQQQQQNGQQIIDSTDGDSKSNGNLRASRSNPDISVHSCGPCTSSNISCTSSSSTASNRHSSLCAASSNGSGGTCLPRIDQALKIYRSDQSFRYIPVCADLNAKQILHLALQEFGISTDSIDDNSCLWAIYECSVSHDGVIKQRRLPPTATNLAETVALNARLYLRDMQKEENTLLPDELIPEVLKQARLTLYTLNAQCIATQLTLQDFAVFSSIEPTEYVNHLFQLGVNSEDNSCSKQRGKGWDKLAEFESLFNREMWWVATEVCCERNVYRRSKLVKKFIKIARHCHLLRNLNSMFAIVSGLEKPAVRRLSHTWERVPGKYLKMLADLQQLMDPSRNMSRYRQHLAQLAQEPPLIPIYPILRKDLTFAHEANPTFCGPRLVNFEKLRMIAQIIRNIQRFSSVHYDPSELYIGNNSGNVGGGTAEVMFHSDVLDPVSATIRKATKAGIGNRFGTSSSSNGAGLSRKKLYERTLMLRRVRAYLRSMPLIDSEANLDRISLECEPPALSSVQSSSVQQLHHSSCSPHSQHQTQPSSSSASTARRRLPSPSPSSLSSQSNQSSSIFHQQERQRQSMAGGMIGGGGMPKFGVESPQAVQKMLALVQNSKIKSRQPFFTSFHQTSGRSHLLQSHGALSASAELPPIGLDNHHLHTQQRKRCSVTSSSTTTDENASCSGNNNERAV